MGRQLPVLLASADERGLLEFLRSTEEVRIFESFADVPAELEVNALPPRSTGHLFFYIWPTRFLWGPHSLKHACPHHDGIS